MEVMYQFTGVVISEYTYLRIKDGIVNYDSNYETLQNYLKDVVEGYMEADIATGREYGVSAEDELKRILNGSTSKRTVNFLTTIEPDKASQFWKDIERLKSVFIKWKGITYWCYIYTSDTKDENGNIIVNGAIAKEIESEFLK